VETLAKLWTDLATTVVDPTKEWLKGRSYWQRVAILLIAPLCILAYNKRETVATRTQFMLQICRVALAGEKIPLGTRTEARLAALAKRIETQAKSDFQKEFKAGVTADNGWAAAQIVVALSLRGATFANNSAAVASFLRAQRVAGNVYWAKKDDPPHLAATAWCIRALASLRQPATEPELSYILAQQGRDGGWPLFVGTSPTQESVFATALLIIALHEQLKVP
jgi:hypothetical protein